MKIQHLATPTGRPEAPTTRTTRSYLIDALAMAVYFLAIAAGAMFLDVPHPLIVAAVIAFVSLVVFDPKITTPLKARPKPSTNP